ncbi:FtsX-like permease family protein [Streptococcus pneumoniae]
MAKRIYYKDLRQSITSSKGRFFSIFSLMMIGAMTLMGLKVTPFNMQKSAQDYLNRTQAMDLAVVASHGLSQEDEAELAQLAGARSEFGQLLDVTIASTSKAFRLFSKPKELSSFQLVKGRLPEKSGEIALLSSLEGDYHLGDELSFSQKNKQDFLKIETYRVTGFVKSSEIWDMKHLGPSSKGSRDLAGYGVILETDFTNQVHSIARLRYDKLDKLSYDSEDYEKQLKEHKDRLTMLLEDNGAKRLATLKETPQKELNKGRQELAKAREELQGAARALEIQESQLKASGLGENSLEAQSLGAAKLDFEAKRKTAEERFAAEEKRLEESQKQVDQLKEPTYTVHTRASLPGGSGYTIFNNAKTSIAAVSNLFPLVLYLVAALVTFTTMTRFVDEERGKAGIFKALGYGNRAIIAKFVIYGLTASVAGTVVGVLLGNFYLSPVIDRIVTEKTVLGASSVHFYPSYLFLALCFSLLSAVLPAYLVAKRDVAEEPAKLLQAKPPVAGAKICLERWKWLWSRFSFHQKITTRNIFRYKQRMLMTIIGVAGSVALLFAGLGIRSSISGVAEVQFGEILTYDLIALENISKGHVDKFPEGIEKVLPIFYQTSQEEIRKVREEQTVSWIVTKDTKALTDFVQLRDGGRKPLSLPSDGVVISTRLAQLYQAQVGSTISLHYGKKTVKAKVAGIAEMYAGHFFYLTADSFERLTGENYEPNAYMARVRNSSQEKVEKITSQLLALDTVSAVIQNAALIQQLRTIVSSLTAVMMILVCLSVLLGLVILYNLTTINVAERIRELSTIKVLGFYQNEVTLYIYRETIVLSIIGMVVGLWCGKLLHEVLLQMIASDTTLFPQLVSWEVYLIPFLLISGILLALGYMIHQRLKQLDMLEALKSVE